MKMLILNKRRKKKMKLKYLLTPKQTFKINNDNAFTFLNYCGKNALKEAQDHKEKVHSSSSHKFNLIKTESQNDN